MEVLCNSPVKKSPSSSTTSIRKWKSGIRSTAFAKPGPKYYLAMAATPFGARWTTDLAIAALRAERPALLNVSYSSYDLTGHVFGAGRQHLDRRQSERGECRRPLFDGAFQQSFEHIHGPRRGEGLLARTFEPLAPDEPELDGLGHAIGIALQEIGDADGGRTAKPMHRIRAGQGRLEDLNILDEVAKSIGIMPGTTICGLADGAAWPIKNAVNKFRDEFEDYIKRTNPIGYTQEEPAEALQLVELGAH